MGRPTDPPCEDDGPVTGRVHLSPLSTGDVTDIVRLERICFIDPWERQAFEREVHNEVSRSVVARDEDGRLIGYAIYWAAGPEFHLLNLAVAPACRRHGIGRLMMQRLMRDARHEKAEFVALEVRRSNVGARKLYRDFGFVTVGIRPRYYRNGEDAEVMVARIDGNDRQEGGS
jgi:ribosomal-protein-alanine N-acetyltransferase